MGRYYSPADKFSFLPPNPLEGLGVPFHSIPLQGDNEKQLWILNPHFLQKLQKVMNHLGLKQHVEDFFTRKSSEFLERSQLVLLLQTAFSSSTWQMCVHRCVLCVEFVLGKYCVVRLYVTRRLIAQWKSLDLVLVKKEKIITPQIITTVRLYIAEDIHVPLLESCVNKIVLNCILIRCKSWPCTDLWWPLRLSNSVEFCFNHRHHEVQSQICCSFSPTLV